MTGEVTKMLVLMNLRRMGRFSPRMLMATRDQYTKIQNIFIRRIRNQRERIADLVSLSRSVVKTPSPIHPYLNPSKTIKSPTLNCGSAHMPLYPAFSTNKSGFLKVSDLHDVYWEECGKPDGLPVVYVHGGPGGGIDDGDRRYFDPSVYRSVLFDQRGCGKSTPAAELTDNTTWHLVSDMEKLREELGIEKWVVFGGSWGSTLSLAYAEKHPERCLGLILRGIFTLRKKELEWFYQSGASEWCFPKSPCFVRTILALELFQLHSSRNSTHILRIERDVVCHCPFQWLSFGKTGAAYRKKGPS
jgi:hypothetical protein